MKNGQFSRVVGLVLAAVIAVGGIGCGKKSEDVVMVGAILPLTGSVAVFGQWIKNGIELGLDDLEKNAEIKKVKIQVVFEDSQNDAKTGISAFNKLTSSGIDVIIVAMSKVAIPLIPISDRAGTILLLQDVTYPDITQRGKNIYRHFIQSDREAIVLARFCANDLGLSRLGILYVNDEAGVGAKDAFLNESSRLNIAISSIESFESQSTDMRTIIAKQIASKPQGVFVFGNGPSWALALKTFSELNFQGTLLTNTAMYIPNFRDIAGTASIEGVYFTYPYLDTIYDSSLDFIKRYQSKYSEFPPIEAAYAYDLVHLIAIAEGKKLTQRSDRYSSIQEFEGAFGSVKVASGDMMTKIAIARIENTSIKNIRIEN